MQRHEMEAWLGDDHGLTDDQITELMRIADEIGERYPDRDDEEDRDAALFAAYELMARNRDDVLAEMAGRREVGRTMERRALAGMQQAALMLVPPKEESEAGLARKLGVDRMAVRGWLGKRGRIALVVTFPEGDADAAFAHYERMRAAAEKLGRSGATWKVTEGWYSIGLKSMEAARRLQREAESLPPGWSMRISQD